MISRLSLFIVQETYFGWAAPQPAKECQHFIITCLACVTWCDYEVPGMILLCDKGSHVTSS